MAKRRVPSLSSCLEQRAPQATTTFCFTNCSSDEKKKDHASTSALLTLNSFIIESSSKRPFFEMWQGTKCFHTGVTSVWQQKPWHSTRAEFQLLANLAAVPEQQASSASFIWRGNPDPLWRDGEMQQITGKSWIYKRKNCFCSLERKTGIKKHIWNKILFFHFCTHPPILRSLSLSLAI